MENKEQMIKATPSLAHLGLTCMILFVLGMILFPILKGQCSLVIRYAIVTSIHAVGFFAGLISLWLAPKSIREIQKNTRYTMFLNALFSILFGYRFVILIMNT